MGFHNVVSAVPQRLEHIGNKVENGLVLAKGHLTSASAAFQAIPMQQLVSRFHEGGLVGLTDLRERGMALLGRSRDSSGAAATVKSLFSVPDLMSLAINSCLTACDELHVPESSDEGLTEDVFSCEQIVGSIADTSIPGFSKDDLVKVMPQSKNVEADNLELTKTVSNAA